MTESNAKPEYRIVRKPHTGWYCPERWIESRGRYVNFWDWREVCGDYTFYTKWGAKRAIKKLQAWLREDAHGEEVVWTSKK